MKINTMKKYKFVLLLILVGWHAHLAAQKYIEPAKLKHFNITVNFEDYTVKTQMLSTSKAIKPNNDLTYMWYAAQKLIETKGGYDGKLIHGTYKSFYLNNQLREEGQMYYGLKNRAWKSWYADGKLKELITWRKGRKNGRYYLYNDLGQLMAKSNFKNDKLHGKFYTYSGNGTVAEIHRYKNGVERIKNQKVKTAKAKKSTSTPPNQKAAKPKKEKKIKVKKESKNANPALTPPPAPLDKAPADTTKKTPFFKRLFKSKPKSKKESTMPAVQDGRQT